MILRAAAALALAVTAANAAELDASNFDFAVQHIENGGYRIDIVGTLTNAGTAPANMVIVECALLDRDGRPLGVIKDVVNNVASGKAVTAQISGPQPVGSAKVSCRISSAF